MIGVISLGTVLKRFSPEKLVDISAAISEIIERFSDSPQHPLVAEKEGQLSALGLVRDELEKISLTVSLKKVDSMIKKVENDAVQTQGDLRSDMNDLRGRIEDELETVLFMHLSNEEAILFNQSDAAPMGLDVDQKFPSAKYDIEEAYKCLAFGRATAASFHSMRVLEHDQSIAKCLGIPNPMKPTERNWGFILKNIKAELDRRWPNATDRQNGDGQTFESLYVSLDAVKNPWRNATMHVEAIYTEENADHILSAVGAFMRNLAARCDENGLPSA